MIKSSKIYKKIAKVIDEYKEDVTIKTFSSPVYSEYGDLVSQTSSELLLIPALFSRYDENSELVKEGLFQPGDVSIFFKGDQIGIAINNIVVRSNGERWKITKVSKNILNNRNMAQEVNVVKDN